MVGSYSPFVTAAVMAFAVERGILFRYTLRQVRTQCIMGPCRRILYRYARALQYERLVFEKEDRPEMMASTTLLKKKKKKRTC